MQALNRRPMLPNVTGVPSFDLALRYEGPWVLKGIQNYILLINPYVYLSNWGLKSDLRRKSMHGVKWWAIGATTRLLSRDSHQVPDTIENWDI